MCPMLGLNQGRAVLLSGNALSWNSDLPCCDPARLCLASQQSCPAQMSPPLRVRKTKARYRRITARS